MKAEQWQTLLDNNNWNNVSLRDARYDQVIHLVSWSIEQGIIQVQSYFTSINLSLHKHIQVFTRGTLIFLLTQVTAAQGAEEFYTLANNHSRSEPVEEARKLDKITQQVCYILNVSK